MFDKDRYIESTKGILISELRYWFPEIDLPVALPDVADDALKLDKPVVFLEYNSSVNKDIRAGRNNGRGKRVKRKLLRFSALVITTGDNMAILDRDRISQKIEGELADEETLRRLTVQGLFNVDCRFVNAYKVRESVHLARLEIYFDVKLIN